MDKACPFCAEMIKAEATVCRFCKSSLSAPAPAPIPAKKGFPTWAILLIVGVVALPFVAIVAAIAIPGIVSAKRATKERHAAAGLKTIATAQADFRSNDRDNNRVCDFWTGDVAGLYCIGNPQIRLIELNIAAADKDVSTGLTIDGKEVYDSDQAIASLRVLGIPRNGYVFIALVEDKSAPEPRVYRQNTGGAKEAKHNTSRFGIAAIPSDMGKGAPGNVLILNENLTMYRRNFGAPVLKSDGTFTSAFDRNWPDDFGLSASWSKMD